MTEPTQESREMAEKIDEALDAAGVYIADLAKDVIAHTIDKLLGREPVDPVKAMAKEMYRAWGDSNESLLSTIEAAIRRGITLAPKAEPKPWTAKEIETVWREVGHSYTLSDFTHRFRRIEKERGE